MRSPARRRRWRLEATSGAGTTRSAAVPRVMTRSGRSWGAEERATPRGNGLECDDVVLHRVGRQLGVVRVAAVLLAVGDQPVEHVDRRAALGLVDLVLVHHQPTVAGDRCAVLAGRVDDGELLGRDVWELLGGGGGAGLAGNDKAAILVLQRRLRHAGLKHVGELDIPDRARSLPDRGGHGFVAFGTLTDRPIHRLALARATLPVGADI